MGSSLPALTRTAKEVDEGVAIPRCALMASSSLEVLENSSVITFSSDRRQRGFMVHRPTGHPQSFIRYWTPCWRYMDNPRKSCRMQINSAPFNAPWEVRLFFCRFARWYTFFVRIPRSLDEKLLTAFILLRAHRIIWQAICDFMEILPYIRASFVLNNKYNK